MNWKALQRVIAVITGCLPARSALDAKGCWSLEQPKTANTPRPGCLSSVRLVCGDVVETPGVSGRTAAQSELLASLTEMLNIQKFSANVEHIHIGQQFQAKK